MNARVQKLVLVVDDVKHVRELLGDLFLDCNLKAACPYQFQVDLAGSAVEAVEKLRVKRYDVVVLDVIMEEETSGSEVNLALALAEEHGTETPVRIVITGYPSYRRCVEAMRQGAWDYIVKEDIGNRSMFQIMVDSAFARLRELDLRQEQEEQVAAEWLPEHLGELQTSFAGQMVAVWHKPEVSVIAHGRDAFELEVNLARWRKEHFAWERPYIVEILANRSGSTGS